MLLDSGFIHTCGLSPPTPRKGIEMLGQYQSMVRILPRPSFGLEFVLNARRILRIFGARIKNEAYVRLLRTCNLLLLIYD